MPTSPVQSPSIRPVSPAPQQSSQEIRNGSSEVADGASHIASGVADKARRGVDTLQEKTQHGKQRASELSHKARERFSSVNENYLQPGRQRMQNGLNRTGLTFQTSVGDASWPNRSVTLKTSAIVSGVGLAIWAGCHAMAIGIAPLAFIGVSVGNLAFGTSLASGVIAAATLARRLFTNPPAAHNAGLGDQIEGAAQNAADTAENGVQNLQEATN